MSNKLLLFRAANNLPTTWNKGNAVRVQNSTDKYIDWGNILSSGITDISILMYLKVRSTPSSSFDIALGKGINAFYLIWNGASTKLAFNIKISASEKSSGYTASGLTIGKTYIVAATYSPTGGANNLRCRVFDPADGSTFSDLSTTQTGNIDASSTSLQLGHDTPRGLMCNIDSDELLIYKRLLTDQEISDYVTGNAIPLATNLELYAKFDESSGDSIDSSGNNHTGTDTGGVTYITGYIKT